MTLNHTSRLMTSLPAQFTLTDLRTHLIMECDKQKLSYDISNAPVKIGPDVYQFFATSLDDTCKKQGYCRVEKFYCLTGGEECVIIKANKKL